MERADAHSVTLIDTTGTLLNGTNPRIDSGIAERIGIAAANLNLTAASGTLLNLRFKVIGTSGSAKTGTSALTFEQLMIPTVSPSFQSDIDANLLTGTTNGNFTAALFPIAASVSISGRALTADGRAIFNAQLLLDGSKRRSALYANEFIRLLPFCKSLLRRNLCFVI